MNRLRMRGWDGMEWDGEALTRKTKTGTKANIQWKIIENECIIIDCAVGFFPLHHHSAVAH